MSAPLPAQQPPPQVTQRPSRRLGDRGPGDTPINRRRRLVRSISADPELVKWLADHNSRVLERVAVHLQLAGMKDAAAVVRRMAGEHRDGAVSPF